MSSWFGSLRRIRSGGIQDLDVQQASSLESDESSPLTLRQGPATAFFRNLQRFTRPRLCFTSLFSRRRSSRSVGDFVMAQDPNNPFQMMVDADRPSKSQRKHVECMICCAGFDYTHPPNGIMQPAACKCWVCEDCIYGMFIAASNDMSRMPPRCCRDIYPIHVVLHLMSAEEATRYREAFEEWMTMNKIYCPNPTCSAFISESIAADVYYLDVNSTENPISNEASSKSEQPMLTEPMSTDSTPLQTGTQGPLKCFNCHKCQNPICATCRQLAHPGEACPTVIPEEVAEQLKRLGYKQCPCCKTGVKKMYGCNHIQCHCGAHWCWGCQKPVNNCLELEECLREGDCCEEDYWEDEEVDRYGSGEPELTEQGPNEQEPQQEAAGDEGQPQYDPQRFEELALDWQDVNRGADFGGEPDEPPIHQAWMCNHAFERLMADSHYARQKPPGARMECHRCWCRVEEWPYNSNMQRFLRDYLVPNMTSNVEQSLIQSGLLYKADAKPTHAKEEGEATSSGTKSDGKKKEKAAKAWKCMGCGVFVCDSCKPAWEVHPTGTLAEVNGMLATSEPDAEADTP